MMSSTDQGPFAGWTLFLRVSPRCAAFHHIVRLYTTNLAGKHNVCVGRSLIDNSYSQLFRLPDYQTFLVKMEEANRGDAALKEGKTDAAVKHYTAALVATPTSPNYYIKRSIAYHRLSKYDLALADADHAVLAAIKRGKRELIAEGQLRRGVTLAAMDRIQDAHICFELAHKYGHKGKDLEVHEAMLKRKRKGLLLTDPKMQRTVLDIPEENAASKGTVAATDNSGKATLSQPSVAAPAPAAPATAGSTTPAASIRHEWYQTNDLVYVTIFAKAVPKDKATIDIQATSLNISFPLASGSEYDFSLEPLFAEVNVSGSKSTIFGTKIEVVLAKSTPGTKWGALEGSNTNKITTATSVAPAAATTVGSGPANPYSSRGGQAKNWDKIINSYQKPADKKAKEGGEDDEDEDVKIADDDDAADGADFFFKKLFKGATPDQQRAMMKSYQESGGTSLSTNWEEVSKAKVKVQPPEGMVEKKY